MAFLCDLAIFRTWSIQILIEISLPSVCRPRSLVIDTQCSQLRRELSCHPTEPCIILSIAVVLHILIRMWMSVVFAQARFCWKSFALVSISKPISKTKYARNIQSSPNQMQVSLKSVTKILQPLQQFCKCGFEYFHRQSFLETMAQPGVMDSKSWEVLDQDGKKLVLEKQLSRCFVSNHHFLYSIKGIKCELDECVRSKQIHAVWALVAKGFSASTWADESQHTREVHRCHQLLWRSCQVFRWPYFILLCCFKNQCDAIFFSVVGIGTRMGGSSRHSKQPRSR